MKNLIYIFTLLSFTLGYSQILEPVKWTTSVEKTSDTEYILLTKATIEKGWHLYSQDVPEGGPIPTTFTYDDSNENFKIIGNTEEEKGETIDDPVFEMKIKFFEKKATFKQKITIEPGITTINAFVEFMVCDDSRCLPPTEVDLKFNLSENSKATVANIAVEKPNYETSNKSQKELWTIFIIAFLSGFAALLTPCVFPMIPMTVSFFTKQSKNKAAGIKNAIIYGICIIVIYVLLGTAVTGIFGADALNALATNVWFNIIFFLFLVFFCCVFFRCFRNHVT